MRNINVEKINATAEMLADRVGDAKRSAEEFAHSISSKVGEVKSQTAGTLRSGADSVRKVGERGSAAAESVASKLDAASSYVDQCSTDTIGASLRDTVKRYPVGSVLAGVALGFCVGSFLTRSDKTTR
jgi:hypothetical protein